MRWDDDNISAVNTSLRMSSLGRRRSSRAHALRSRPLQRASNASFALASHDDSPAAVLFIRLYALPAIRVASLRFRIIFIYLPRKYRHSIFIDATISGDRPRIHVSLPLAFHMMPASPRIQLHIFELLRWLHTIAHSAAPPRLHFTDIRAFMTFILIGHAGLLHNRLLFLLLLIWCSRLASVYIIEGGVVLKPEESRYNASGGLLS